MERISILVMGRGTTRNMQCFMTKLICEISASSWFYYKETLGLVQLTYATEGTVNGSNLDGTRTTHVTYLRGTIEATSMTRRK